MDRRRVGFWAMALYAATCTAAAAHPHAWIDVRTTIILNGDRMQAIEEEWLFDEFHTVFALSAVKGRTDKASLLDLARRNLANLKPYGYFTEVTVNGSRAETGTVETFDSAMRGKRLWLRFVLPVALPPSLKSKPVLVSIYDPTYYIEMLHQEGEPIYFRGDNSDKCLGNIRPPKPTMREIARASALDRSATADTSLGRVFAQKVILTCK